MTLLGFSLPLYRVTGANYISNPGTNAVPGCNTTAQVATCANYAAATGPNVGFSPSGIESTSWNGIAQAFADNSAAVRRGAPLTSVFSNLNYVRWCASSAKAPLPPAAWFGKFADTLTALPIVTVIQDCDYPTTLTDAR